MGMNRHDNVNLSSLMLPYRNMWNTKQQYNAYDYKKNLTRASRAKMVKLFLFSMSSFFVDGVTAA